MVPGEIGARLVDWSFSKLISRGGETITGWPSSTVSSLTILSCSEVASASAPACAWRAAAPKAWARAESSLRTVNVSRLILVAPDFTAMSTTVWSLEISSQKQADSVAGGVAGNRRRSFFGVLIIRVHGKIDAVYGCRRKGSIEFVNQSVGLALVLIGSRFGSCCLGHNSDIKLRLVRLYRDGRLTVNPN